MSLLVATGLRIPRRLDETSVTIEAGTLACLIGPNGSGKTSLLHAIAGIGSPGGRVRIDDIDPFRLGPPGRQRLLTYLPASRDVKWPLVARDLIRLGGEDDIEQVLADLDLEPLGDRRVDQLSTGERARVLLARALAPRPKLLLLDEPVANLDPLWQVKLMERLRTLTRQPGRAVLMASHDLDLAGRFADRLIVMDKTRAVADGGPEILEGPHIPAVFGVEKRSGAWWPIA
ncbi:ABC transporter ATP-binding protein [Sphingomonas sp.]|uniref:ABC transporter ATP-binding protein n=1 Tax=Sphingomonas sp. TaxID=28214 RepID=UPI001838FF4C|nr:ABC transporter ATP-binding protein [Sphingomonas sp.]MBA3510843.1 ABC transporter ATP-binding protein [Sphingomonas sp.]